MDSLPDDFAPDALSSKWRLIATGSDRDSYEAELRREAPRGHRLWDVQAHAVAVRIPHKEVIYWLIAEKRWAWVHLTWTAETDPEIPSTFVCGSWAGLLDELADADRA